MLCSANELSGDKASWPHLSQWWVRLVQEGIPRVLRVRKGFCSDHRESAQPVPGRSHGSDSVKGMWGWQKGQRAHSVSFGGSVEPPPAPASVCCFAETPDAQPLWQRAVKMGGTGNGLTVVLVVCSVLAERRSRCYEFGWRLYLHCWQMWFGACPGREPK